MWGFSQNFDIQSGQQKLAFKKIIIYKLFELLSRGKNEMSKKKNLFCFLNWHYVLMTKCLNYRLTWTNNYFINMDLLLILVELLTIPVSTFFSKFIICESAQNMLLHCTFWSLKKNIEFFFHTTL